MLALSDSAQAAYVHARYAEAIDNARAANRLADDRLLQPWLVLGAAACFAKDKTTASEAISHVDSLGDSGARQFLRYACRRNLIELP
jgi:hypothetical protein